MLMSGRNGRKAERTELKVLERHLEYPWDFFGICSVYIGVSDWSDMEQFTVGGRRGRFKLKHKAFKHKEHTSNYCAQITNFM